MKLEDFIKQLTPEDGELPEDLKKDLFGTLDSIRVVSDIVDLFTVQFVSTEVSFIDTIESQLDEEKKELDKK